MLYAILCYAHEETVFAWSKEEEDSVMAKLIEVQTPYAQAGKLGPVGRLMPTTAATTVRKGKEEPLVLDGPFAETKEVLLGFYTLDVETLEEAVAFSKALSAVNPGSSSYEIRPFYVFHPGEIKNSETKT
ncbi:MULTISPECIES: YciI family protein [Neorhizobium]|uniref:DGPFAETKE family protein n=2 Tax=Neorhizobium galegae TaxID=399 RepID=A0A068SRE6_NEOGA|nr:MULTISPECIES: YciI family protein [Neorhizobium]KAB1087547.1 YciI family protein [Neorhizobium galegae]MCJ9753582.1 YciI family protein [Neorhizobium sp. BETTINA12A]MCQ1850993.1 YciI family protein [Neorhizobium galegae]CDN48798.1 DGPFAETKE family protein [Neorhizobium galegae bv. orientalis str. HAMBI 540]CDZ52351.1 DGPFAETKE family protein [Neorhizobium galegae bv. orientalis]